MPQRIIMSVFPQEIAKRIHEEEEQRLRRRSRGQESHREGTLQVSPCLKFACVLV